ncbi:cytochrome c oxidase subunit II [Dermatophilaceae bacterium Soc4.6]
MRKHDERTSRRRRGATLAGLAIACALFLSGCAGNGTFTSGYLPQGQNGGEVTANTARVTTLWNYTWIAALAVGALVWGLTVYVMVRYRRRKEDTGLPPQLRYNVPIEMLYTVVPVFMVAVLFYYTARDESALIDVSKRPDVTVNVVAKQWSWDFNYVTANTYESGVQTQLNNKTGVPENAMPVLFLPEGKRVEFVLNARDVIHDFWVPAFLQKMDMLPGKTNRFQIVPTQQGTFQGKCAELCGAYHSQMLFVVKVVSPAEYDTQMQKLRDAGQSGQLPNTLNREPVLPKDQQLVPSPNGSN